MSKESLLLHAEEDKIHSNQIELKTRKDKFKNWWHYSRFLVIIGLVFLVFVGAIIYSVTHQQKPDYKILLMTHETYPAELVSAMQSFFTTVANDRNGDGVVQVQLDNYTLFVDEKNGEYAQDMFEAARTRYASDVYYGESMIYLFDAASFNELYEDQLFVYTDGSTPEPDATDYENMMLPISECKLFSEDFDKHIYSAMFGLEYTEEYIDSLLEPLYVGFRCTAGTAWEDDEEQLAYYYDSWDLYQLMIEGKE